MKYLILLVCLSVSCTGYQPRPSRPYKGPSLDNVVALTVLCSLESGDEVVEHYQVGGTGNAIGPDLILTADHVIDCEDGEALAIMATRKDGRSFPAMVLDRARDPVDVAVLKVVSKVKPFKTWAKIATDDPVVDEEICVASANPGPAWRLDCGHILRFNSGKEWGGDGVFAYAGWFIPGSSGSAIFNNRNEIVGVHVGAHRYAAYGIGYTVSSFSNLALR